MRVIRNLFEARHEALGFAKFLGRHVEQTKLLDALSVLRARLGVAAGEHRVENPLRLGLSGARVQKFGAKSQSL